MSDAGVSRAEHDQRAEPPAIVAEPSVTFDVSEPFVDVFADSLQTGLGPFGVQLTFALTDPATAEKRKVVARVRMSPQLALVMAQMLRRVLRQARDQGIGISVPAEVMKQLGLEEEI